MIRKPLAYKVGLVFFLSIICPLIILLVVFYGQIKEYLEHYLDKDRTPLLEHVAFSVENILQSSLNKVKLLSSNDLLEDDSLSDQAKQFELEKMQEYSNIFESISLIQKDGRIIDSSISESRVDWFGQEWFKQVFKGKGDFAAVQRISVLSRDFLVFMSPIPDGRGDIKAVVVGLVNMDRIKDFIGDVSIGRTGRMILVDNNGKWLAYADKDPVMNAIDPKSLNKALMVAGNDKVHFLNSRGQEHDVLVRAVGNDSGLNLNWRLCFLQEEAEELEVIYYLRKQMIGLILGGILAMFLWAYLIRRIVIHPVRRLTEMTRRIASGDLSGRVTVNSSDELGDLGNAFNSMANNLVNTMTSRDDYARGIDLCERTERELNSSRMLLFKIIDVMPVGIVMIGSNHQVLQANKAMARLLGIASSTELIGKPCQQMFCGNKTGNCSIETTSSLSVIETTLVNIAGRKVPVLRGRIPVILEGEIALLETYVDISDRISAEQKLREAKDFAEDASQMKNQFIANVSHEIRTPLNCIIGFAETIHYSRDLTQAKEKSQVILREAENLLKLVNNLLDSAKLEAGKVILEQAPFDLHELVRGIQQVMEPQVRAKGIDFRVAIAPGVPVRVKGDALRLRQALMNLAGNSIKFTDQGFVSMNLTIASADGERVGVRFEIADSGIGISPDRQSLIFERFSQADDTITRRFGGTGLGTAISQQLVQQMGGEIKLSSEEGKGSVFFFTIAFIPDMEATDDSTRARTGNFKGRILLAEDYPANQEVVRLQLEGAGYYVVVVADGVQAVRIANEQPFDLVILDIQMPNMDGLTAAGIIRKESLWCKDVPMIVVTANTSREITAACYSHGILEVLAKPVKRQVLLTSVEHWIKKS